MSCFAIFSRVFPDSWLCRPPRFQQPYSGIPGTFIFELLSCYLLNLLSFTWQHGPRYLLAVGMIKFTASTSPVTRPTTKSLATFSSL